jgi:hypothetical protein
MRWLNLRSESSWLPSSLRQYPMHLPEFSYRPPRVQIACTAMEYFIALTTVFHWGTHIYALGWGFLFTPGLWSWSGLKKNSLACAHLQSHGMACPLELQDIRVWWLWDCMYGIQCRNCGQNFIGHQAVPQQIPNAPVLGHTNALKGVNGCESHARKAIWLGGRYLWQWLSFYHVLLSQGNDPDWKKHFTVLAASYTPGAWLKYIALGFLMHWDWYCYAIYGGYIT